MKPVRILHVDNDPLMRDIVKLCLVNDSFFILSSCANAEDAIAIAISRQPDVILSDVTMSMIDGSTMLTRLRSTASTATIPIILLAARTEQSELERLKLLGANAVITKPFDPATLARTLRYQIGAFRIEVAGYNFDTRLRADAALLATFRKKLSNELDSATTNASLLDCAHKLAGAAGVFNYRVISNRASALEEAIMDRRAGLGTKEKVATNLDALLACIEHA
jgi:two-component system, OmpR family, response regulator